MQAQERWEQATGILDKGWDTFAKKHVEVGEGGVLATAKKRGWTLATCEAARMETGRRSFEVEIVGDKVNGLYVGVVSAGIGMEERSGKDFAFSGEKRAWLMLISQFPLWFSRQKLYTPQEQPIFFALYIQQREFSAPLGHDTQ